MDIREAIYIPKPVLTETNLPDQSGKVFIVTGANSGVGKELATILYSHNAKVYVAARSKEKSEAAIEEMRKAHPDSKGTLVFLHLDLGDLTTIKKSAETFLAAESKLDVLWLNAGVMTPPQGSKTTQGYELQLGTNNLGHFLFVKLILPIMRTTAATAPKDSVRIIWVSSSAAYMAPKPAIDMTNLDYQKDESPTTKYCRSKAGNAMHSVECSRRTEGSGILNLSLNPGNLKTPIQRQMSGWLSLVFRPFLYEPIFGAYTELYAGLSTDFTSKDNGGWVIPWGRKKAIRKDLTDEELCRQFWEWSEEQVKPYA